MTEFHRSYVESEEITVNNLILKPVNVNFLAVVCRQCQPMKSMSSAFQAERRIDSPGAQECVRWMGRSRTFERFIAVLLRHND
jgi:hypothetical protein